MNVRQIIGQKPIQSVATISANESINAAASELAAKKIGALVVSEDGASVDGILSERDVVRRLANDGAACGAVKIGDAMMRKVTTCGPQDSAVSVLQRMTEGRFRHMPVVDGQKNLIGMLSQRDFITYAMRSFKEGSSIPT